MVTGHRDFLQSFFFFDSERSLIKKYFKIILALQIAVHHQITFFFSTQKDNIIIN